MKNKERFYFLSIIWKTLILIFVLWGFVFLSVKISDFENKIQDARYEMTKYNYGSQDIVPKILPNKIIKENENLIIYFDKKGNETMELHSELPYFVQIGRYKFLPLSLEIGRELKGNLYVVGVFDGFFQTFYIFGGFLPFFIIWSIVIFKNYVKLKNEETIFKITRAENTAGHQSLTVLTENLHHELNTPLTIIEGKIKRIEENVVKIINYSLDKNYKNFSDLTDEEIKTINSEFKVKRIKRDKEYLDISLDQIKGILINMKNFKMLRHSNGNKTFYDILSGSANTLKISIGGLFDVSVDPKLKNYRISHSSGMKNSDLINAVINHVKNSYEANAEKIYFKFEKFENDKLCFHLGDTGNGIPKKERSKIFEPNYSTKTDKLGHIRGNGMFVNKKILENFGCSVELFESHEGVGTIFQICIPAEELKED